MSLETQSAKLKVMVVEDDDYLRDGLQLILEAEGHSVISCSGAQRALNHLRAGEEPEVIVLDLLMPGMNGWEFRLAQKKEPRWSSIPTIALSGDLSAQAQAIDATAHLGKPLDARVFLDTVERVGKELLQSRAVARASEVERLVSLGSLVGGIAHEINNPLAVVDTSVESLERQLLALANPARALEPFSLVSALRAVERTKLGVERIAAVVQCVSLFASADPASLELLDVHRVLDSSLQVASNEVRHSADLERSFEAVPHVLGNPAKLGQVFLNLVLNALHAIRASDATRHKIRVSTYSDGPWVVVTVSDTASIVIPELTESVFDPLAPSVPGRLGLHFGLAISREVVESMGGSIEVERTGSTGALFRVRLPSRSTAAEPAPAPTPRPLPLTKRCSVVVVDDDPLMCEVLTAILDQDYDVVAFTSPRAALESVLEGAFDLVLCDVMMPELNGMDLFERLSRERPDMMQRFIFITGGAFTERARSFLKQTQLPSIPKPFARRELMATIQATLAAARGAN